MRILVTGAAGFVGRHVVAALAGADVQVRALVHGAGSASALDGADCELVRGDVTDPGSLADATSAVDAVVHLVAIIAGRPADFERVMVRGTENVIHAAPASGVQRIVYVSALGVGNETKACAVLQSEMVLRRGRGAGFEPVAHDSPPELRFRA